MAKSSDTQIIEYFFQTSRQLRQLMRMAKTHLIVDDDESIANLIKEILSKYDIPADSVTSLIAAKEYIEEKGPENIGCIILDVTFPQDNGVGFAYWLSKTYPDIPFFIYTCADVKKIRNELRELGVPAQVLEKQEGVSKLLDVLGLKKIA